MIAITDYGMGNLRSVQKAFELLGAEAIVTSDARRIQEADKIVLPGVGAFKDAMTELNERGLTGCIQQVAQEKPFLGICLGLQLLFTESEEGGIFPGLDLIPGRVVRFQSAGTNGQKLKVPHMGWNALEFPNNSPIFSSLEDGAYTYFVHSYYVVPEDESVISSRTAYGISFTSSITKGQLFATQFHPEKSQKIGLQILRNFIDL